MFRRLKSLFVKEPTPTKNPYRDSRGIHLIHASAIEAEYWISTGCRILPDPDYPDFRLIEIIKGNYVRVYVNDLPKA